jgi:DNA-binding LacI/PurR family transcriptional regulator
MGRRLARMVLDLEEKAQLVLPTELVVRESTKTS